MNHYVTSSILFVSGLLVSLVGVISVIAHITETIISIDSLDMSLAASICFITIGINLCLISNTRCLQCSQFKNYK